MARSEIMVQQKREKMKILVIGNDLIYEENRRVWSSLCDINVSDVDLLIPKEWKNDFIKYTKFIKNDLIDENFTKIYVRPTSGKENPSKYYFNLIYLWTYLNLTKYDHIIVANEALSLVMFELRWVKKLTRNLSTKLHIISKENVEISRGFFKRLIERWIMKGVDKVFCSSKDVKNVFEKKNISKDCKFLPYSFSPELFDVNPIKFKKDPIYVGFIGKLSEEKGIKLLIEAVNNLNKNGYNLRTVISGDGELKEYVRDQLDVDYLGKISGDSVISFYKKLDIVVLPAISIPTWQEQTSRIIVEATASGKLVIGSTSGCIPEIMKLMSNNYLFQEGSLHELENVLEKAICDILEGRAEDIVTDLRLKGREVFSHNTMATRIYRYLNKDEEYGTL